MTGRLLALALGLTVATATNATNIDGFAARSARLPLGAFLADSDALRAPFPTGPFVAGHIPIGFSDNTETAVAFPAPLTGDYSVILARTVSLATNRSAPLVLVLATRESTSWTMILLGFGLLGAMMRWSSEPSARVTRLRDPHP